GRLLQHVRGPQQRGQTRDRPGRPGGGQPLPDERGGARAARTALPLPAVPRRIGAHRRRPPHPRPERPGGAGPVRIDIAWWDLDASAHTVDTLRTHLADAAAVWAQVPGLRLKLWMADRDRNRWGAVMVWESRPSDDALP